MSNQKKARKMDKWLQNLADLSNKILKPSIGAVHWVKVHPRLFLCSFPGPQDEHVVSEHLHVHHSGKFFLWSLSAERLENGRLVKALHEDLFDNQVLEFSLPHHPAPLELLLELCKR